jgi:hypothetical protein
MPNWAILCNVEEACTYMLNISKNQDIWNSSQTMVKSSDEFSDDNAKSKDTS